MNMRVEKGSFRESFKHYERRESTKVFGPNRHFELVYKKGQWRIIYGELILLNPLHCVRYKCEG